ncbi:MAG: hypothetical protein AAF995_05475 [Planctomycetota bacterium]
MIKTRTAIALAAAALLAPAALAQTADVVLTDGNATATFGNPFGDPGFFQTGWDVAGTSHLSEQSFLFRDANGLFPSFLDGQGPTGSLVSDTNFDGDDDTFFVQYDILGGVRTEITYSLAGGEGSSISSTIGELISFTNTTSETISFSFWQFVDLDLGGDSDDSRVEILGGNTAEQADAAGGVFASESVTTPSPDGFFAGTIADVNDWVLFGGADSTGGSFDPAADLAWAFRWDFTLEAGDTAQISKLKSIVPTPGAAGLLAMGGLFAARRRRA